MVAIGVGVLALFLSIFALGRALASPLDEQRLSDAPPISDDAGNIGVELNEFAIQPTDVEVVAGSTIGVTNAGGIPHNIEIVDTNVATGDINAGDAVDLDLSSLEPGSYAWICSIEGHEAAGMTGTLTLVEGEGHAQPRVGCSRAVRGMGRAPGVPAVGIRGADAGPTSA